MRTMCLRVSLGLNVLLAFIVLSDTVMSAFYSKSELRKSFFGGFTGFRGAPECSPPSGANVGDNESSSIGAQTSGGLRPYNSVLGVAANAKMGNKLAYVQPLWTLTRGEVYNPVPSNQTKTIKGAPMLLIPSDVTRICIDVGAFLSSPTARKWWSRDPRTFVVAFEPNVFSAALLNTVPHPAFVSQLQGYWPSCSFADRQTEIDFFSQCQKSTWGHITAHSDRFLLLPIAVGPFSGFSRFYTGLPNRSDGGSLYRVRGSYIRRQRKKHNKPKNETAATPFSITVGVEPLQTVLELLPAGILWDTLKIDAQGIDRLIIGGAGSLLEYFVCILGEFNEQAYRVPKGRKFDYKGYLNALGFLGVKHGVFINSRFRFLLQSGEALCSAADVVVRPSEIRGTFASYFAKAPAPAVEKTDNSMTEAMTEV